jgi:peptidoglycan L-alanyl-D-glutamate endopeptidase CwlK
MKPKEQPKASKPQPKAVKPQPKAVKPDPVEVKPQPKKFKLGKGSILNLVNVNKILVELTKRAITKTPVDFGIIRNGGFRTAEMQAELYSKGRSRCDGYIKVSHHQLGNAVDLIPYIDKKYTWENLKAFMDIHKAVIQSWNEMRDEGLVTGVQLIWGGDWKNFVDLPHYQIRMKR